MWLFIALMFFIVCIVALWLFSLGVGWLICLWYARLITVLLLWYCRNFLSSGFVFGVDGFGWVFNGCFVFLVVMVGS